MPLLVAYLGQAGLGVWLIALSFMGLIGFVSTGMSTALVTEISRNNVPESQYKIVQLISAATLIAAVFSVLSILFLVPLALWIDWARMLGVTAVLSSRDIAELMVTLAILLSATMIVAVPRQVMLGRMHGYLSHLMDFAGVVAGALGLVLAIQFKAPLWVLGLSFVGPPVLTLFAGGLFYLHRSGLTFFSQRAIERQTLSALWRDSLRMSGYQGAHAVSSQSDLLLIGLILGAPASAAYGIALRVFSLPILLSAAVNYAQWPVLAKADAEGRHDGVSRLFRQTLFFGTSSATAIALIVALAYQPLVEIWLGAVVYTDAAILVGMIVWVFVATLVNTCDSLLRARQQTHLLMLSMVRMAVLNIVVTLILLPLIGPAGAIWGSVTGFALALLVPYLWHLRGDIGFVSASDRPK